MVVAVRQPAAAGAQLVAESGSRLAAQAAHSAAALGQPAVARSRAESVVVGSDYQCRAPSDIPIRQSLQPTAWKQLWLQDQTQAFVSLNLASLVSARRHEPSTNQIEQSCPDRR